MSLAGAMPAAIYLWLTGSPEGMWCRVGGSLLVFIDMGSVLAVKAAVV